MAGASLLTAIAASLCCITPVLAMLAGTSGLASTFSWLEPARPYLIAITVAVLGFAWWQKLRPSKASMECDCEEDGKRSFLQTKAFLGIVTVIAALMLAFPYYSKIFYPDNSKSVILENEADLQTLSLKISGMTCRACEEHVEHAVNELPGIVQVTASFENGSATVKFDRTKTSVDVIQDAIDATGYKVVAHKLVDHH